MGYFDSKNPYRRYKLERDQTLTVELLRVSDGELILEVGCGYGRVSRSLLASARIQLVGLDLSEAMLRSCKQELGEELTVCRADAGRLPFRDGSFDAVVCTGVLMHLPDQRRALAELGRVLRPGGRLVVSGNNLLSFFAVPMTVAVWLRSRSRQVFKTPWFYRRILSKQGVQVHCVRGDTLLAVGFEFPRSGVLLPPRFLFSFLRGLDRWVDRFPLNLLAYEVWFLGQKSAG